MKPRRGLKYENHWGTVIELLDYTKIYHNTDGTVYKDLWEARIIESGEKGYIVDKVYIFTGNSLGEEGFKPLKMYGTKLWKVLNEDI